MCQSAPFSAAVLIPRAWSTSCAVRNADHRRSAWGSSNRRSANCPTRRKPPLRSIPITTLKSFLKISRHISRPWSAHSTNHSAIIDRAHLLRIPARQPARQSGPQRRRRRRNARRIRYLRSRCAPQMDVRMPATVRDKIVAPVARATPDSRRKVSWNYKLKQFIAQADHDWRRAHYGWRLLFPDDLRAALLARCRDRSRPVRRIRHVL